MFLVVVLMMTVVLALQAQQVIRVQAGNAQSLLDAIEKANRQNADKQAERLFILVPDGLYDLGERVLTTLTGHNIAIVGQSMKGTIIRNAPDVKNEGISKTGTLVNRGTNLYLQDLTLQNALDYYGAGFAGRAVCLQDKGNRTICKRVRMLSYQDTYYSDNEASQFYFEDSEIHGTVDFICGAGDVFFDRCRIVTERRSADGKGRNVIAAPRTRDTKWGYIFNRCTIENVVSPFVYARAWKNTPHCIWLHTTLLSPEKLEPQRFDSRGMGTCKADFLEYGTVDKEGRWLMPTTHVMTFTLGNDSHTQETVLTKQQAKRYKLKHVFPDWQPKKVAKRLEKQARRL